MILFVDDEPRRMDSFVQELRYSGYEVEFQQDVDSAFRYIQKNAEKLDLIILDILMPPGEITREMDTDFGLRTGICFLDIVKKNFPSIPIFVLTNTYVNDDPWFNENITGDKKVRLLYKMDLLPFELAEKVQDILAC